MERFLLVGTFGAVGAALAAGTAAALLRYHRTGEFPGAEAGTEGQAVPWTRLTWLWIRVAIGTVIAAWAVTDLAAAGLL